MKGTAFDWRILYSIPVFTNRFSTLFKKVLDVRRLECIRQAKMVKKFNVLRCLKDARRCPVFAVDGLLLTMIRVLLTH